MKDDFILKGNEGLQNSYSVVIPTTLFDVPIDLDTINRIRETVKVAMAKEFGGYTETTQIGGYISLDGRLIEEVVYHVESYYKDENDMLVYSIAQTIKEQMKQECVMVKKNNKVIFI